ncbi:MAG: hypothetical protein QOI49_215 [Verrucomicrobiota bacterium]|jgi:hypothetical protein
MLVAGFATAGFGQATRTWVSGVGDDVNPCSRTAPCKTFAGAISKTAEGGEIDVLDPGGFGTVTITKALTLDGTHGSGFGSILNAQVPGINVNITSGTHINDAVVILRSLYIQGASQAPSGAGTHGINVTRVDRLFVDDCHIEGQTTTGINANMASAGALFVRDCDFENTNTAIKGTTTVGKVLMDATNISVHGNTNGVQYLTNAQGSVTNSFFSKNTGESVGVGATCVVNVTHCHFRGNNIGVSAAAGAAVRVNENELFDNNNGFQGTAASFQSGGNNKLAGNTASVAPTGAPLLTQ